MPFKNTLTTEDLENIKTWLQEGLKFNEIANRLDNKVSRQRIQQLADKFKIDSFQIRRNKAEQDRNEKMFAKWGPDWKNKDWKKSAIYSTMREKFRNKQKNTNKHEFTIEFSDLTFPTHCPALGIELDYFANARAENSPSFDRLNPSKGYVKGNVTIISWRANRIKNDGTAEEHQKIADFMRQSKSV